VNANIIPQDVIVKSARCSTLIVHGHGQPVERPTNAKLAIATTMPGDVASIWNCINCLDVSQEVFVWIVGTIQLDDTVISVKKVSIAMPTSRSLTRKHVDLVIAIQLDHQANRATTPQDNVPVKRV
jgi:hypothetical protein